MVDAIREPDRFTTISHKVTSGQHGPLHEVVFRFPPPHPLAELGAMKFVLAEDLDWLPVQRRIKYPDGVVATANYTGWRKVNGHHAWTEAIIELVSNDGSVEERRFANDWGAEREIPLRKEGLLAFDVRPS